MVYPVTSKKKIWCLSQKKTGVFWVSNRPSLKLNPPNPILFFFAFWKKNLELKKKCEKTRTMPLIPAGFILSHQQWFDLIIRSVLRKRNQVWWLPTALTQQKVIKKSIADQFTLLFYAKEPKTHLFFALGKKKVFCFLSHAHNFFKGR